MHCTSRWRPPLSTLCFTLLLSCLVALPSVRCEPSSTHAVAIDLDHFALDSLDADTFASMSSGPPKPEEREDAVSGEERASEKPAAAALIVPFDINSYTDAAAALLAYAEWHNRILASPEACAAASVLVWEATAGWGDSVNALATAFRYALASSVPRLFFIQWPSRSTPQLWKLGLSLPGFAWDLQDFLKAHSECGVTMTMVQSRAAVQRSSAESPVPRVVKVAGSMVSSHPLSGALSRFYNDAAYSYPNPRHVLTRMDDAILQDFLLRPNEELQAWIDQTAAALAPSEAQQSNWAGAIGFQIRSGFADAAAPRDRPSNAFFLAPGDEALFQAKFSEVLRAHMQGDASRTKLFVMSDHPQIRAAVIETMQSTYPALEIVAVQQGSVSHCGPDRTCDSGSFLRLLTEWFTLKRAVRFKLITAWSLLGSSAAEGAPVGHHTYRIDASNCGQPGARPCQMG